MDNPKVPSLNVQAFLAAYDKYIVSAEDSLVVATHILSISSDKKMIGEIILFAEKQRKEIQNLETRNRLLEKAGSESIKKLIEETTFDYIANSETNEIFNIDILFRGYKLMFSPDDGIIEIRKTKRISESFYFEGSVENHVCMNFAMEPVHPLPFPRVVVEYIFFLWRDVEENFPRQVESEGINYNGLNDIEGGGNYHDEEWENFLDEIPGAL